MGKIGVIIQARMGSTRLPAKVMLELCGKTVLAHDIERVQRSRLVDEVIIATTTNPQDQVIYDEALRVGAKASRGSEEDVLDRYYQAAKEHQLDVILRVTSDCPLIDWEVIDKAVEVYLAHRDHVQYVSNVLDRTYPRGLDVEVFDFALLEHLKKISDTPELKEHVTTHVELYPEQYKILHIKNDENLDHLRWTLDTPEDFEMIRQIYEELYPTNPAFLTRDILELLQKRPDLIEINQHIEQKEVKKS